MERAGLLDDTRIRSLILELQDWPGPHLNSHKSPNQFFHKLAFLADLGFRFDDPGIAKVVERILAQTDEHGVPCLPIFISAAHGGKAEPLSGWALCDAPTILYTLKKLGVQDQKVDNAADYLATLIQENGFGCVVSKELGTWRGPGKKSDPCPYATLTMLKLMLLSESRYSKEIDRCARCLLDLWEHSRDKHPYIFYMGTDFRKIKLPFIWYDLLHVVEVLSQVWSIREDWRLQEMFALIKSKETAAGYIPESVYQPYKEWDFGQKKYPSTWMNERIQQMESRLATV
jgi:hypothetical protein